MVNANSIERDWLPFVERYKHGEWRASIFRDMILIDADRIKQRNGSLTLLDIGCGAGFDNDATLQRSLSQVASEYIGVEPDENIGLDEFFTSTHRCRLEDATIEPNCIDIAFSVMVLEHIDNSEEFWCKIHEVLKDGGVFWGLTVDARHWFVSASNIAEKLCIKEWYLNRLHGKRGDGRYDNYCVFYKNNNPKQIKDMTKKFKSTTVLNFNRVGQVDYYLPQRIRFLSRIFDRIAMRMGWPGSIMAVRVQK